MTEDKTGNRTSPARPGESLASDRTTLYQYYILSAGVLLVMAVCAVLFGMAFKQDRLIKQQVYEKAEAIYDSMVLMRQWNADHGGVYVLKSPGMVSNPYLDNPDITDTEGHIYTLKNPALMTREMSEYAEKGGRYRIHITSLNLKNPNNEPDEWERRALTSFEDGEQSAKEVISEGEGRDERHYFRFMKPLFVKESCLKCHEEQGYKVGEVRGGISVTLPFDDAYHALQANFYSMVGIALLLVVVFALILYLFVWRLMRQLAEQKEELVELNATKDMFLRIAAHDLRNPLVVISGYADLLKEKTDDEKNLDLIRQVRSNADKMVNLINNLLDVSKIRKGTMTIAPVEADVSTLLEKCISQNEMLGDMKGIRTELVKPSAPVSAMMDRECMAQVIDNLLGNAFKFSHPGTTVTLGARVDWNDLVIWVTDEGVGIPPEDIKYIFDEFTKGCSRPTGGESSTGLGLAIVKRIVELHGGRIDIESEAGKGTTFTIRMPLSGARG